MHIQQSASFTRGCITMTNSYVSAVAALQFRHTLNRGYCMEICMYISGKNVGGLKVEVKTVTGRSVS